MSAKPPADCTGSPKCTHVKMPHGWKSHVEAHLCHVARKPVFGTLILSEGKKKYIFASVKNRHNYWISGIPPIHAADNKSADTDCVIGQAGRRACCHTYEVGFLLSGLILFLLKSVLRRMYMVYLYKSFE